MQNTLGRARRHAFENGARRQGDYCPARRKNCGKTAGLSERMEPAFGPLFAGKRFFTEQHKIKAAIILCIFHNAGYKNLLHLAIVSAQKIMYNIVYCIII